MQPNQRFPDDILPDFRENKGLRIRAGTGAHRFIGITAGAIKYARDLGSAKSRATTLELKPLASAKKQALTSLLD